MSGYKNHWTSENQESYSKIEKLGEDTIYNIKDVQKIETSFGKRYVLIDEDNAKFWPNKSVEEFIREHKNVKQFELRTSFFKTFKNKKGEEISYLSIDIDY